jgi:hypothetical protein
MTILRFSELFAAGKVLEYELFGRMGRVFSLLFKVTEDHISLLQNQQQLSQGLLSWV